MSFLLRPMIWYKFIGGMVAFLFPTALPANAHYSFPEWCWTSFRTVAHEEGGPYVGMLYPTPAGGCLETDRYVPG